MNSEVENGSETCLGGPKGSLLTIYDALESIVGFGENPFFCQKSHFQQIFINFGLWWDISKIGRRDSKNAFETLKMCLRPSKHFQIPWMTLLDDLGTLKNHDFLWFFHFFELKSLRNREGAKNSNFLSKSIISSNLSKSL